MAQSMKSLHVLIVYYSRFGALKALAEQVAIGVRRVEGVEIDFLAIEDLPLGLARLDEEAHEVFRGDLRVSLSPTEFKLLRYLMANAGRVLSKAQILDHVWHYDFRGDDSIVESYISYLRRKIDVVEPRLIHTLRGVGYVLRLPI